MKNDGTMTRREWLAAAAAAGAATLLPADLGAFSRPSRVEACFAASQEAPQNLQPFPMAQVRLRPGIFRQQMEANRRYLDSLPNDRLLHMFRVTAGLPSQAEPLGGWEEPKCELRGHFAGGHILSACALQYAGAGDEDMKRKGDALVAELAVCQKALDANGYLGAYPAEFYDRLREGKKVWAPFYTYHKILAGHLDMYTHCGNEQALETAERMAGWVETYLKPIGDEQWARMQMVEHGGMNEALFDLYASTKKERYLALARRFDHKRFFDPLADRRDELKGLHANTNIPKVIGAARGYGLTGDPRYREIAKYFWHQVTSQRTYCTGGTSNNEAWRTDPGKFSTELGPSAEECCCSYNMMKLTRHIYGWTGDSAAMDYYERALFNTRLGTQDSDGMKMYYLSLAPGLWKTFGTPYGAFWCCTGTGAEEFAKFTDSIYWHDGESITVNQFISSEVHWPEKGLTLVQETNFPEEAGTTIKLKTTRAEPVPVRVRIPGWVAQEAEVTVVDRQQGILAQAGRYCRLEGNWKSGGRIRVRLPMALRREPLPDDPTLQAARYGPLALAGRLGRSGLTREMMYGPLGPDPEKGITVPPIARGVGPSVDWIEPVRGTPLEFRSIGAKDQIRLSPLYKIFDERYTVYWKAAG